MQESNIIVLPPQERAAIALKSTERENELRKLAASSADIVAVIDGAGRDQSHRIAMTLRSHRTDITKEGKAARDDATKFSSAVIAEEKRLIGIIQPEEDRVLALRDAYDAEQARIEAERVAKERARMDAHELALLAIYRIPVDCASKSAADVLACRSSCENTVCGDEWEEYKQRAAAAYAEVLDNLGDMYRAKLAEEEAAAAAEEARETERKRVAAEAEALAIQRAEQQAEAKRLANQQAEMKRQADEIAAQRAALESDQRAAQQAKEDAAKLEADHAEALEINAAGHYFSKTTFRDDGKPIMCNPNGTRNIFCDVDEEYEPATDTRPAITVEVEAIEDAPPVADQPPTLRLGMISQRLGFSVTAAMLLELGFTPSGKDKAAVLFHEHQFGAIARSFINRIETAIADWEAV